METTDDNLKSDAMTSEPESNASETPTLQANQFSEQQLHNSDVQVSLPPIVEDYLKRITAISVGVIFLSVVMMMVTGGRLASQVDGLQAATLSLTKRVVNMNSALEQVSVLDSKLELLDLGHASLIDSNGEAGQSYIESMEFFGTELSKIETSVLELDASAQNVAAQIGGVTQSLSTQEQSVNDVVNRLTSLESQVSSLKRLERDIRILVEIEQGNLKELFRQQLELEQRELVQGASPDVSTDKVKDPQLNGVVTYSTSRD